MPLCCHRGAEMHISGAHARGRPLKKPNPSLLTPLLSFLQPAKKQKLPVEDSIPQASAKSGAECILYSTYTETLLTRAPITGSLQRVTI